MIRRWIAHWKCRRQLLPPEVCRYLERMAESNRRHLPLEQVRFVVLDTETSGLNPRKDLLLSIGAVAIRHLEIVIEDSFEAIIAHKQQFLPQESISIHGLRPRDIREGETAEAVLRRWLQYVGHSVLVGQHIAFDRSIISAALHRLWGIRLYNPAIDTAHLAMRIEHPNRAMEAIPSMLSALWSASEQVPVPESVRQLLSVQDYDALYLHSITFPEQYWGSIASELVWERPWEKVLHRRSEGSYEWFTGGLFNITVNALDRHASGKNRNKVALICAYEDGSELLVTYDRLLRRVSQTANGLKAAGVQKGDRVAIILPPGPEAVGAMLAAARIGALHAFVYPELGAAPLRARHRRVKPAISLTGKREKDFIDYIDAFPQWCDPVSLQATDPLFIAFTSGAGSEPRGIVHAHGSYAVAAYHFGKTLIGVQDSDILWTLAELSWIVGHTAMVYMPLLCGSTSFIRAGSVFYPENAVFWKLIQRHGINVVTFLATLTERWGSPFPRFASVVAGGNLKRSRGCRK